MNLKTQWAQIQVILVILNPNNRSNFKYCRNCMDFENDSFNSLLFTSNKEQL